MSLEFATKLFENYIPRTIGMDLTEVNFDLTAGGARATDEQTFRELFELICHQVNQPAIEDDLSRMVEQESYKTVRL